MDKRDLHHAIIEVKEQLRDAKQLSEMVDSDTLIDRAFKLLIIDELRELNKNFERLNNFNSEYRR